MLGRCAFSQVWCMLSAVLMMLVGSDHVMSRKTAPATCLLSVRSNISPAAPPNESSTKTRRPLLSSVEVDNKEHPAEWFGAFHEAESTYDDDLDDSGNYAGQRYVDGWSPSLDIPDASPSSWGSSMPSKWFAETHSGGPAQAWQTYYPDLDMIYPRSDLNPPWIEASGGTETARQVIKPGQAGEWFLSNKAIKAPWFDSNVLEYDVFGRVKEPREFSGRSYVEWTKRTRTAPLKCGPIGCIANATIEAYDAEKELGQNCQLDIRLHATDFENDFSHEHLEWVIVNDRIVNAKCDPMAQGCNTSIATEDRPLYSCVSNYDLNKIVSASSGVLNLAGKLNPYVDECPVDGNLLSGVAAVTCFVRLKPAPQELAATAASLSLPELKDNSTMPLECAEKGCEARASLRLHPEMIQGKTCLLTIRLQQTDFDGDEDANEEIEFIKIQNVVEKEHVKPGRNPCKEKLAGNTGLSNEPMVLVDKKDVTNVVGASGELIVAAKISDMVDECGIDGNLLKGEAEVICS